METTEDPGDYKFRDFDPNWITFDTTMWLFGPRKQGMTTACREIVLLLQDTPPPPPPVAPPPVVKNTKKVNWRS